MRAPLAALALLAGLLLVGPAGAEDGVTFTGTLKTINDRGTILIGVRDSAIPFAFRNPGGQPVGFSVDLCHEIAADAAKLLHLDLVEADAPAWQSGLRIVYVAVAADQRLPKVIAGEIDLECGSTTATDERAKTVAFSPVFFLAGTKLMVPAASAIATYRNLKSVAVSAGTTNGAVMKRLAEQATPPFNVVETPDVPSAYAMLASGSVDAIASDDILLAGLMATDPNGKRFRVLGDYLSFEPYGIMLRRDDPDFSLLVRQSFGRMAQDGILSARYRRWFTDSLPSGENLALPMSAQLTEMYRALGMPD